MRIYVLTLFPQAFESPLSYSIVKRARDNGLVDIALTDIRDFAEDSYRKVDDKPYGGGPGMVMMPGPVFSCVEHVQTLFDSFPDLPTVVGEKGWIVGEFGERPRDGGGNVEQFPGMIG